MDKVDVLIVGSGAAGSLAAAKLAKAGKKVLILEGGPERGLSDLYSSQIWSRKLKWAGPPTETVGKEPLSVNFGNGWGSGGSAMHHYAVWLRLHAADFEMKTRFGRGLDWPLQYDELRPFYDRIQKEVGISGDAEKEVWRPAGDPYPMPPLQVFAQGKIIEQGFTKLDLRTSPLPMAINSTQYNGRAACVYDGWCDAGCPIFALANPLAVYLLQAREASAEVRHQSVVGQVLTDAKGERATGVEYFDSAGERHFQQADVVILAANAFQNPRILLNSATDKYPHGLTNSGGKVGKYMMAHTAASVFGLFREDTQNYLGVTGGQLLSQENYAKDASKGYLSSSQWLIANALKPNDLLGIANARPDLFGDPLHKFLATASKRLATMTFVGEKLPRADDQLVLSGKKDAYGLRLARVTHEFGPDDIQCFDAGMKQGQEIFKAAGAYDVWTGGRVRMHAMGGIIMGDHPKASVTNSYGQTHDIVNLFVAGSSLFPTSGAVNPTLTIHALTLRACDYMIDNWPGLVA